MHRRLFLTSAAAAAFAKPLPVRALTSGPRHHFFGYYGIPPWNKSGRSLVCLESDFQNHLPEVSETARVTLIDAATGKAQAIAQTHAWNFQQGTMLHWNPLDAENEILFNDRVEGRLRCVVLNTQTGKRRILPRPIQGACGKAPYALCLDYGRLGETRRVVGVAGARDENSGKPHPTNDGVVRMDIRTGETKLLASFDDVYQKLAPKHPELKDRILFFNHTTPNKSGTRLFFLARVNTPEPDSHLESAMFTVGMNGEDLREVVPFGLGVSHFDWRNDQEIIATFRDGSGTMRHQAITDGGPGFTVIGAELFDADGHCTYSPDGEWIATDRNRAETVSKEHYLYHLPSRSGYMTHNFPVREKRFLNGDLRCDLHSRWSRDGRQVCVDALDERDGTRQLHLIDTADR